MRAWLIASLILGGLSAQDFVQGVAAYKSGNYAEATLAFRRAVSADPGNNEARLYLATALKTQYVPGAHSPENEALAEKATAEFEGVLARDSGNKTALTSLANLAYEQAQGAADLTEKKAKLDLAAERYHELASVAPQNKEAYYSLGVIDWLKWYPSYVAAREKLGMKPEDSGPLTDYNTRQDLRLRFEPLIEDGIRNLQQALEIDPKYDDAMAYTNLFIREQADLKDTVAEYRAEVAVADQWVQKALDTKKEKAEAAEARLAPPVGPANSGGTPQRIRVAGTVQAANLITKVNPVYPDQAKEARIQGIVRFTAFIDREGQVSNLQLVSGHPLFVEPARQAVAQWKYKPTLLNGVPVEVITQVDVNFTLSQ